MGRPKALLPLEPGGTVLGRILGTLADAHISPLVLVTRAYVDVEVAWQDARAATVIQIVNPDPARGQLSSLLCGVDALRGDLPAILVTLVDIPLPRAASARALVDAWRRSGAPLVRPIDQGRHGHPVLYGRALVDRLRTANPEVGAKPVVRAFADEGIDVLVDDPGVLVDIDSPDDYARLIDRGR
jgi:molybdenum cofactor cytidylyltransferase